jgi:hypothetical protein
MSLKKTVITWAESGERDPKSWQESNFSKIEREYNNSNGEMSEDELVQKFSDELAKTGKHLSDSEKRDLRNKLF